MPSLFVNHNQKVVGRVDRNTFSLGPKIAGYSVQTTLLLPYYLLWLAIYSVYRYLSVYLMAYTKGYRVEVEYFCLQPGCIVPSVGVLPNTL